MPEQQQLIISANVNPNDIDVVHAGLPAQIRLSVFNSRSTPLVDGTVTNISADRFINDSDGTAFYRATVEIDAGELEALDGVSLHPGMPAEVLINTGSRTALQYLMSPITDNVHRALRED